MADARSSDDSARDPEPRALLLLELVAQGDDDYEASRTTTHADVGRRVADRLRRS